MLGVGRAMCIFRLGLVCRLAARVCRLDEEPARTPGGMSCAGCRRVEISVYCEEYTKMHNQLCTALYSCLLAASQQHSSVARLLGVKAVRFVPLEDKRCRISAGMSHRPALDAVIVRLLLSYWV